MTGTVGKVSTNGAHIDTPFAPPATKADVESVAQHMRDAGAVNVTVSADPNVKDGWILSADWIIPSS
jgi:hypothetical protein